MASNTRDVLSGLLGKAKDLAESSGVMDVYEKGARRAKSFGNATRLTMDLGNERRELMKLYAKIGSLYVEARESGVSADLSIDPLLEKLRGLRGSIAAKEAEINAYKASFGGAQEASPPPTDDLADFEAVVNRTEDEGKI